MAEFGLIKSFDIDNGELDGKDPKQCFVLGYELALIDALLEHSDGFERTINSDNRSRIEKSCLNKGRSFSLSWASGDQSESWMYLQVKPISNDDDQPVD